MDTSPLDTGTAEALVAAAVTAPSMHNAQPWTFRFRPGDGLLQLRREPSRSMPATDLGDRAQHLGCGAALFNLRVAAARHGWLPRTTLLPSPDEPELLAELSFRRSDADPEGLAELYEALPRRRTSREPFTGEPVPPELRDALSGAAVAEGCRLTFLSDWQVDSVLELTEDAAYQEATTEEIRAETERWVRTGTPGAPAGGAPAASGIPAASLGPRRWDGRAPVRDFEPANSVAGRPSAVFESHPCLAVLGSRNDAPPDWLVAGQAMERVLLRATVDGLSTALSSQALERPEFRWAVRDPFAVGHPQMILRLGYGPPVPATPRRPVAEVLEIVHRA
ncbi:nitroreductase [Streptomyces sp. NPDC005805]|uniref:Acg family FMN-binding oxidoreductase n=1 Tax=Streptomyces sp. NPDC005805 TaxID=3157068 RepID=UPI0033EB807D